MTFRTRHLATGILAAALLIAPVACSDDDGDDNGSTIEQNDTTTTVADDGTDEPTEGTDEPTEGTDEPTEGTDEPTGGTDEGAGGPTETVVTPPEAVDFCDQLISMSDIEPDGLDEIRGAFAELDDVVPDDIRDSYDTLMDKLAAASSEDELDEDTEAMDALLEVSGYAATNCQL